MPRVKTVSIAGKQIHVEERRIGELKQLLLDLVPGSGGDLANVDLSVLAELSVEELLYKKLPQIFTGLTAEDVDNAYMNEIEALVEAFIDVHFLGLKRLIRPMVGQAQNNQNQQLPSRRDGTTQKH